MSLYNMVNGVNPVAFYILPVLGKHPDEYPRFRDAFIGDESRPDTEGKLIVYTRTGGGNREAYEEENQAIRDMPGFLFDYDDDFDSTFACWVFDIPDKWKQDVKLIMRGDRDVSPEYVENLIRVYPKLEDKFREIFSKDE